MRTLEVIERDLRAAYDVQDPLVAQLNDAVRGVREGQPPLSAEDYDHLKGRVDSARSRVQALMNERKRTRAALRAGSTTEEIDKAIELLKRSGFVVVHGKAE
jgi:wobble nucleotide-excising tRNase